MRGEKDRQARPAAHDKARQLGLAQTTRERSTILRDTSPESPSGLAAEIFSVALRLYAGRSGDAARRSDDGCVNGQLIGAAKWQLFRCLGNMVA
jgi:hypothetical protein